MLTIFYIGNDKWSPQLKHIKERLKKYVCIIGVLAPKQSQVIKKYCLKKKIPLILEDNANQAYKKIKKLKPNLIMVSGHPYLLRQPLLSLCPAIGFHPSLLPARRGRAPLNWAIIDGLKVSGVTAFHLAPGVDNGNIIYQEKFKIGPRDTAQTLIIKVNKILRLMNNKIIKNYPRLPSFPQDESKASYTPKRTPKDSEITLSMKAKEIERLVRALTGPYPTAFIRNNYGEKIFIKEVSLKDEA